MFCESKANQKLQNLSHFLFFLYAIATKTASANVKSHIEKNEKKIFYETAKIYLYNLKKIFDANLVVD